VIGAGVIGLASAAALRRAGNDVTIIDRLRPVKHVHSAIPAACRAATRFRWHAGHSWKVPGYLFDPLGPLALRWRHLPALAPWLLHFVRAGATGRFAQNLDFLTALMRESYEQWDSFSRRPALGHLVRNDGALSDLPIRPAPVDRPLLFGRS